MKINLKWMLMAAVMTTAIGCDEKEPAIDLQVATQPVSDVTAFSAKSGGAITGAEPISERGICWASTQEPTTDDAFISDIDAVEGEYALKMLPLQPATTYYVRAYAKTTAGKTVYGNAVSYKTADLNVRNESNSYMVIPEDAIVIPVSRANKSALGNQIGATDALSVVLVWMDNMDVIDTVFTHGAGADGKVVVMAGNVEGNAVVAVKVNNQIKWSWHIWVTQGAKNMGTITMPSGSVLMDRNLGATSKTISEIGAVGVQFQFGRKDPFTASASFGTPSELLLYDLKGANPAISTVAGPKDLAFVTANPHTFVKSQWVDWCNEDVRTWWANEAGTKTIYDPCPEGWRVPSIDAYAGITDEHFDKTVQGGHNFTYNGQSNFFAYTGYREVEGAMDATANYGTMWVNSAIPGAAGTGAALSPSFGVGGTAAVNGAPRARALSIRCIKE
ncbi:MAG: hypothetical protein BGP01_08050 [Paludibacter sp. 47-17]|nr:MAG: hypothetical protein ABS72_05125 [Paludibacter sp. SCN 50-10]OJX92543.1 MAG: hypothetical protein BGP01_08050 [Paludibacter sp. 47-17]